VCVCVCVCVCVHVCVNIYICIYVQVTIGIDFVSKTMYLEDRIIRLQLW